MSTLPPNLLGQVSGRSPRALVVRDLPPEQALLPVDWSSWYLTDEEDMGEGTEQAKIIATLLSCIEQHALQQHWRNVLWSGDQFFAWIEGEPNVRVSPDVYLLDDPPAPPLPRMWSTWIEGHNPPRLAIEVVSEDWEKDYEVNPPKYAQLGTQELIIYDPDAKGADRAVLQVYRRQADGAFTQVERGPGPVFSEQLGLFLFHQLDGGAPRLRLALDSACSNLVPTAAERADAEAERAQAEAERAQAETERAQAETERADREAEARARAEARVRELEEQLRNPDPGK